MHTHEKGHSMNSLFHGHRPIMNTEFL